MTGLLHHLYHSVEADGMMTVRERGIELSVKGTGGCERVALYAWNLHKAAHWVTGHAEVMLKAHLCGIFYLRGTAAEHLAGCAGGHGACHAHLALTAYVGTAY